MAGWSTRAQQAKRGGRAEVKRLRTKVKDQERLIAALAAQRDSAQLTVEARTRKIIELRLELKHARRGWLGRLWLRVQGWWRGPARGQR